MAQQQIRPKQIQPSATDGYVLTTVSGEATWAETTAPTASRWEPLTNGDVDNPELIFSDGDVIMVEVFD